MLDDLDELRTFQLILAQGSLSGAGREMGVSLAVVSKRLASLERRTGHRLIHRTTRKLAPTEEGAALNAHLEHVLEALETAEKRLRRGREELVGVLRVSAPIGLGRLHVAPVLAALTDAHPLLEVELRLGDGLIDLLEGRIDVAVRIGPAQDSAFVMHKLADSHRILVASPGYLDRKGRPNSPRQLQDHRLLRTLDWRGPWRLTGPKGEVVDVDHPSRLRTNNGEVVQDWALSGQGVTLKSAIDVDADVAAGRLEQVLPEWTSPDAPIYALLPSSAHVPQKARLFLSALGGSLRRSISGKGK
jgi:DNA-binding transcriptional LysR family regulator